MKEVHEELRTEISRNNVNHDNKDKERKREQVQAVEDKEAEAMLLIVDRECKEDTLDDDTQWLLLQKNNINMKSSTHDKPIVPEVIVASQHLQQKQVHLHRADHGTDTISVDDDDEGEDGDDDDDDDDDYINTINSTNTTMIVSNKHETLFLSSNGDILTSRCRYTPYPMVLSSSSSSSSYHQQSNGATNARRGTLDRNNSYEQHDQCCSYNPFTTTSDLFTADGPTPFFPTNNSNGTYYNQHEQQRPRNQYNNYYTSTTTTTHGGLYGGSYPNDDDNDEDIQQQSIKDTNNNRSHEEMKIEHDSTALIDYHSGMMDTTNENTKAFTTTIHNASTPLYRWNDDTNAIASNNITTNFDDDDGDNNNAILLIKSFDYSQYSETGGGGGSSSIVDDIVSTTITNNSQQPAIHHNATNNYNNFTPTTATTINNTAKSSSYQQQELFHGIPTFLPHFSNIKIRKISAHPLGGHVLLISQPGILYSYGNNMYGQLGIGSISHHRDIHHGYIMRPTIVTALLENGGKTIACAAGVSHSLVVVEMEEQRIIKSKSYDIVQRNNSRHNKTMSISCATTGRRNEKINPNNHRIKSNIHESVTIKHHQMYGFGRNDYMKIGLISPKVSSSSATTTATAATPIAASVTTNIPGNNSVTTSISHNIDNMECVKLPRRVALHCSVRHNNYDIDENKTQPNKYRALPPKGIFAIAASAEHSAALVHQPNGDVELYTWGNATYGTLGLPMSSSNIIPPPSTLSAASTSIVATNTTMRVAPHPTLVPYLSNSSNMESNSSSLLNERNEFPTSISLSRCCSFVTTNIGRCFSFGTSEDGMLGLGRTITETQIPMEIAMPEQGKYEKIRTVSAGTQHVSICTDHGNVYSWGSRSHAGFDIQTSSSTSSAQQNRNPLMKGPTPIEELMQFEWSPRRVEFTSTNERGRRRSYATNVARIVNARAGNDCTFFVTENGKVLSSGKSSGRIAQGEYDTDITIPKPLFGGLHLFHQKENDDPGSGPTYLDSARNNEQHISLSSFRSRARRMASV